MKLIELLSKSNKKKFLDFIDDKRLHVYFDVLDELSKNSNKIKQIYGDDINYIVKSTDNYNNNQYGGYEWWPGCLFKKPLPVIINTNKENRRRYPVRDMKPNECDAVRSREDCLKRSLMLKEIKEDISNETKDWYDALIYFSDFISCCTQYIGDAKNKKEFDEFILPILKLIDKTIKYKKILKDHITDIQLFDKSLKDDKILASLNKFANICGGGRNDNNQISTLYRLITTLNKYYNESQSSDKKKLVNLRNKYIYPVIMKLNSNDAVKLKNNIMNFNHL